MSIVAGSCTCLGLSGVFVAQITGSFALAGTQFFKSKPANLQSFSPSLFSSSLASR
jgi:hypothetical protein